MGNKSSKPGGGGGGGGIVNVPQVAVSRNMNQPNVQERNVQERNINQPNVQDPRDAREEAIERAEAGIKQAKEIILAETVASIVSKVAKAAVGIAAIAAAVNPATLPAVAGAALVIAVILELKAGHKKLIAALKLNSIKFMDIMDFLNISDTVIQAILAKNPDSLIKNLRQEKVTAAAETFRMLLLSIAPPDVIKMMKKIGAATDRNIEISDNKVFKRSTTIGSLLGTISRIAYSSHMIDSIVDSLQELINECVSFQARFLLYLLMNMNEFSSIVGEVKASETYKQLYVIHNTKTTTSVTPKVLQEAAVLGGADALNKLDSLQNDMETIAVKEDAAEEAITVKIIDAVAADTNENPIDLKANVLQEQQEDKDVTKEATDAANEALIEEGLEDPSASSQGGGRRRAHRRSKKSKLSKKKNRTNRRRHKA